MLNQKIQGCGFHHVAIRTSNWDKSLDFYINGLGFNQKIAWNEIPNRAVMLDTGDGNYLEIFEREIKPEFSGEAHVLHFCLRCDDCEKAVEIARAAGAKVTAESSVPGVFTAQGLKTKIAFIEGPDGEIVEFFESPDL